MVGPLDEGGDGEPCGGRVARGGGGAVLAVVRGAGRTDGTGTVATVVVVNIDVEGSDGRLDVAAENDPIGGALVPSELAPWRPPAHAAQTVAAIAATMTAGLGRDLTGMLNLLPAVSAKAR
jgi:hypothetical protein